MEHDHLYHLPLKHMFFLSFSYLQLADIPIDISIPPWDPNQKGRNPQYLQLDDHL